MTFYSWLNQYFRAMGAAVLARAACRQVSRRRDGGVGLKGGELGPPRL